MISRAECLIVTLAFRIYDFRREVRCLPLSRSSRRPIFSRLSPGITELGCHPAIGLDLQTMYLAEREVEAEILCKPELRSVLENLGIELCSFADIGSVRIGAGQ